MCSWTKAIEIRLKTHRFVLFATDLFGYLRTNVVVTFIVVVVVQTPSLRLVDVCGVLAQLL